MHVSSEKLEQRRVPKKIRHREHNRVSPIHHKQYGRIDLGETGGAASASEHRALTSPFNVSAKGEMKAVIRWRDLIILGPGQDVLY